MAGGDAGSLPIRLIERMAAWVGAPRLIPITRAHVDGCLYHGPASLDFARTLAESGATVTVPTTLNVSIVDLVHPELFRGSAEVAAAGHEMVRHYTVMGCRETWTCAPYQLHERPAFGEQIAWAESNAIVFANSVLGARTERYGDFIDICAAITGVVPDSGLHTDEGRLGTVLVEIGGVPDPIRRRDDFFALLGHIVGRQVGTAIPVIDGIEAATEDQLKAMGAAAASSGAVAMFHMVGITPEAPTRREAFGGRPPARTLAIGPDDLADAAAELSTTDRLDLAAVSVGTPHYSLAELERLHSLLAGRHVAPTIEFFVSTGRETLAGIEADGLAADLRSAGVQIVTDTCTYITAILGGLPGAVMTDSAKWAWYAPGNLGTEVVFAGIEECVESAVRGTVWRDTDQWRVDPVKRHADA